MGLKNLDSKSIDLLMMTYGWRKYTLEESVLAYEEKREDNYDHLKINNPGPEKNGRSDIRLISPEGGGITILRLNESRETFLPFDSLDAYARQIMVLPDDDPSRNSNPVIVEFPENTVYTDSAKLIKTGSIYFKPEFAFIANDTSVFNQDRAIMIEAVTIKGKQTIQKKYVDKNAEEFKYVNAFTLYNKEFKYIQTFEDILYKLHLYCVDKPAKKVYIRGALYFGGLRPGMFVVDNAPIYGQTYSPIAQMRTSEIASVTVIRGPQGFARYGNEASYGAILITTKIGNRLNGGIDPDDEANPGNPLLNQ